MEKEGWVNAIASVLMLSVAIIVATVFVLNDKIWVGPVFISLGFVHLIVLRLFGREIKTVWPDLVFGAIDNGFLVVGAIIGANFAGIIGAIVGGAAINTITDGMAGIFEGWTAGYLRQNKIKDKRTAISSAIGKMAGCLFGAGIFLLILWTFFGKFTF